MIKAALNFAVVVALLSTAGCVDRNKNEQVIQGIGSIQFVDVLGLTFRPMGDRYSGGTKMNLATKEITGELVSTNGTRLPPQFAERIAARIRLELQNQGCQDNGGPNGGGIHYTVDSNVSNSNIDRATVCYSLQGAEARIEVIVIERDYAPDPQTHVVGQLILIANESR